MAEKTFQFFRFGDAPLLEETDLQPITSEFTPFEMEGWARMMAAGYADGQEARVLVQLPGLTLFHIWNKRGYPTPPHTHDVDCLYFVVAGTVSVGRETLGPGDCFFIPADTTYTYEVGPEGAEVLEIRRADNWDLKLLAKSAAYFEKAVRAITDNAEAWKDAERPSRNH